MMLGIWLGIGPDATLGVGILGGVGAQDGAEDAELDPARIQLRIDHARHVSADIVAPIGVADVGRRRREPRLEGKRVPHRDRVAGETDLVAMIAQPSPAMEKQRTLAFARLIGEMNVVQPPRRTHAGSLRIRLLLPVEPPEVHALLLQRMVQDVQVVRRELLVGDVERDILLRGRDRCPSRAPSADRRPPRAALPRPDAD